MGVYVSFTFGLVLYIFYGPPKMVLCVYFSSL